MTIKEFLKPTFFKFNLTLILLAVGGYVVWPMISAGMGVELLPMGFPMATRRLNFASDSIGDFSSVNFVAVVVDIAFWYVVSSAVALWSPQDQTRG